MLIGLESQEKLNEAIVVMNKTLQVKAAAISNAVRLPLT
jgi:hypothetical protein